MNNATLPIAIKWFSISIPSALLTLMLFILMFQLIDIGEIKLPKAAIEIDSNFVMPKVHPTVIIDEKLPTPITPPMTTPDRLIDNETLISTADHSLQVDGALDSFEQDIRNSVPNLMLQPSFKTPPIYPTRAIARGIEGYVELHFSLSAAGRPFGIKVITAEPASIFNRAAIQAVEKWRYEPSNSTSTRSQQAIIRFKMGGS